MTYSSIHYTSDFDSIEVHSNLKFIHKVNNYAFSIPPSNVPNDAEGFTKVDTKLSVGQWQKLIDHVEKSGISTLLQDFYEDSGASELSRHHLYQIDFSLENAPSYSVLFRSSPHYKAPASFITVQDYLFAMSDMLE